MAGGSEDEEQRDFFVSYTAADVAWAEWAAHVLEEAGWSTLVQAWDFRPGSNFVLAMHDAARRVDRVLPLLSEGYLRSVFATPEWAGAFAVDPLGREGRLVPVRVGACQAGKAHPPLNAEEPVKVDVTTRSRLKSLVLRRAGAAPQLVGGSVREGR